MLCVELPQPRVVNGVVILGPDLFARDDDGGALSPIASVFPRYRIVVTGRGIHAMQVESMVEYLRREHPDRDPAALCMEEEEIYRNAVSLLIRGSIVLIRSDPGDMERIFHADDVLQRILPKERIQFTGMHLAEIRRWLRWRGESWRISPAPRSVEEICSYIQTSRVKVGTETVLYQNAPTGGRFLTFEEFMRIRPLIRSNPKEALARLKEIVHLSHLVNKNGARELSLLLPAEKRLSVDDINRVVTTLDEAGTPEAVSEAETAFDRFALKFAESAGPDLIDDDEGYIRWRTTMFCRLFDINERMLEEWALGLSPEFLLNVRWLPGARLVDHELTFEPMVGHRVRSLILHYWHTWEAMASINVGRVESPQTSRDRTGEERDVYLVVLGLADGREVIRLVRLIKWGVMHRIQLGIHRDQAIYETYQYRDYIFDRLLAASKLGIPILAYTEIRLDEDIPGLGSIPVILIDRTYVPGMVTDKIPAAWYAREGFIARLARLLGEAAGANMVLGRANPKTGHVFFDDGDEVIQFDDQNLPERIIMAETTGSFADWSTPLAQALPHYIRHAARHLEKARAKGASRAELATAVQAFADSLTAEIQRLQHLVRDPSAGLRNLFSEKPLDLGSIRFRWESILNRLESTDTGELRRIVGDSEELRNLGTRD